MRHWTKELHMVINYAYRYAQIVLKTKNLSTTNNNNYVSKND